MDEPVTDPAQILPPPLATDLQTQVQMVIERLSLLSPRELQVIEMAALTDLLAKQIAERLGTSPRTIEQQLRMARAKLGLRRSNEEVRSLGFWRWNGVVAFALGARHGGKFAA